MLSVSLCKKSEDGESETGFDLNFHDYLSPLYVSINPPYIYNIQSYIMFLSPSMYIYTCSIYPPGFLPSGWAGRTPDRSWLSSVVLLMKVLSYATDCPPHVITPKTCVAQSSVFLHLRLESLCVFVTLCLSLPPSLSSCLSLYLNILFSM